MPRSRVRLAHSSCDDRFRLVVSSPHTTLPGAPPLVLALLPHPPRGGRDCLCQGGNIRQLSSLVAPALLLPLAAALALTRRLPDSLATLVEAAPLLVFSGGALLGIITRRGRLVLGVVVLALADCALVNFSGRAVFDAVALLLPLNLAVIAWLREDNPLAGRGALLFGFALLQGAFVALLQHPEMASISASIEQPLVSSDLGFWTALPQLAVFAYGAALGVVLTRFFLGRPPLAAGAAWALVASFLALDGVRSGSAGVHFAVAGLLLVVGAAWEPTRGAHVDDVTGLPASLELNKWLQRLRSRRGYSIARVQIDEFARFREEHGVPASHRMQRLVAKALTRTGGGGRAFYCGVHTFAVVFRRTPAATAARHLDVVRRRIEAADLDVSVVEPARAGKPAPGRAARPDPKRAVRPEPKRAAVQRTVSVTISAGIAYADTRGTDPHEIMVAAERALDRAKQAGLNRVSV
jgi:GGDEF domain-containing protein